MTTAPDGEGFGEHDADWAAWQATPWGRLRYRLATETLMRAEALLGGGRLRVLDVGGADAADSVPLATRGHQITVLDPSEAFLSRARTRASQAGVSSRVETVAATLDGLPSLGLGEFDLVLCHNVLHYLPDLDSAIRAIAGTVSPSGLLSAMCPNPAADVLAAAIRLEDPERALSLLDAETVETVTFSTDVRRVDSAAVESLLLEQGFDVEARYGLLAVTTYIANDERKHEPEFLNRLEALELQLLDREPYRRTARIWQLLARRR